MAKRKSVGYFSGIVLVGLAVLAFVVWQKERDSSPTQVPILDEATKQLIVDHFVLNDPMVRDVSITQEGRKIKIVVMMRGITGRDYAKQLGENVVRMVKSRSADRPPGMTVGEGIYDYGVAIGTNADNMALQGVKLAEAASISW